MSTTRMRQISRGRTVVRRPFFSVFPVAFYFLLSRWLAKLNFQSFACVFALSFLEVLLPPPMGTWTDSTEASVFALRLIWAETYEDL